MKDYIILKDYNSDWCEIFLYDHELTNEEVKRAEEIVQKVMDKNLDYTNEDIEQALDRAMPYVNSIIVCDSDDYHTIWY